MKKVKRWHFETRAASGTLETSSACRRNYYNVAEGQTCRHAKDANSKFTLCKRCQQQPSANHTCNHIHVYELSSNQFICSLIGTTGTTVNISFK